MRITYFMRDARLNTFSIERLYEDVRNALPPDMQAIEWSCRSPSRGIFPRLRDAWAARRAQGDVNHVTGDTHYLTYFLDKSRTVLTVHDLVTIERSTGLKRWVFWFFWFWLPVMRSRLVITVSETTRQALLKAVRCDPSKVVVIHNPVSEEFRPSPKEFNVACPRILQVGTKSNKNIPRVAQALAGLPCKMVIVGPLTEDLKRKLEEQGVDYENHVGLSREALLEQYIKADMLIFASTYEGFGLPIVEANALGRPVISSNLSPMTEVANGAACLVDPFDAMSIGAGVKRVMEDYFFRGSLVEAGYMNAKRFRPETVARQYVSIYKSIVQ